MSKEEWSDDDMPTESWADRARDARNRLQKKLAEGGALMFALLFVFGIFFGAAAKAVAARSILIGYWDYTVSPRERSAVNLNALQQEIARKRRLKNKKKPRSHRLRARMLRMEREKLLRNCRRFRRHPNLRQARLQWRVTKQTPPNFMFNAGYYGLSE